MFDQNSYIFIILNFSAGLLTLLGAVGIFVSLIIQRRVGQLQDILEELLDLSYADGKNTTVKIQNLIYKYQMQYMLPVKPIKTVIAYINLTIALVVLFWVWLLFLSYRSPFKWESFIYLWPMLGILGAMVFYRQLIKNTINPVDNHMFNSIIPSPRYLRSIAFLSSYVNVSVGTIIQQARPTPVLRKKGPASWDMVLKEELPFDDYHYFFCLIDQAQGSFFSFGHIIIELDSDPITGKPRPTARNLNIPLGEINQDLRLTKPEVSLLIFPKGEKHPIEFSYVLDQANYVYFSPGSPSVSVNHLITYSFEKNNTLNILVNDSKEKCFQSLPPQINAMGVRWYFTDEHQELIEVGKKPYVD